MPGYYATDMTLVGTGSDGDTTFTLTEATAYNGGTLVSATTPDTDSFIQGIASMTGLSAKTANSSMSLFYDRGTTLNINNGNVLNLWTLYGTPSALDLFGSATGSGTMVMVGTSVTAISTFRVDGRDTLSYGGWRNYVVDLRNANTGPDSTGSTNTTNPTNRYYGVAWKQTAAFKTAVPMALDAIRYGRQTMSATAGTNTSVSYDAPLTSTAANFPQMAYYNDYNAGGTPTLSATAIGLAINGGYHRLGSLQEISGGYSAKGIISLGTSATAVYFDDANRNINFEDAYLTYNDFNRIEIRHASSTVRITAVAFSFIPRPAAVTATYVKATPRCNFEMHNSGSNVYLTSCSFTDMGTFIFLSGGTVQVYGCTFRRCNQIQIGGTTFGEQTLITNSTDLTGGVLITQPSDIQNSSFCHFDNNAVAIKITTAGEYSFNGHQFTGNTVEVDYTGTAATKTITNATTVAGVSFTFTSAGHGYSAGQKIVVKNVVSSTGSYNNAANEYFTIASVTTDTFTVNTAQSAGTYTSGGIATIPCLISPTNGSNVLYANCTASGGGYIVVDTPSVTLTFTGVVSNSEVRVIRVSDRMELGGIENTSGDYVFTHKFGGTLVDIYILHLDYQWYPIYNYTLLSSNASIPVSQIPDRQYDTGTV